MPSLTRNVQGRFCAYMFPFLVAMIRFLVVLNNFLEDPSVNHFCDVGILIKDYPHHQQENGITADCRGNNFSPEQ